jgi:exodeoxyribonuclease V beta subunit
LIGDPKQSIYGFRGADIFSYMEAVNDVDIQYTLGKNWRSAGGLIKAVNAIFGGCAKPFIYESLTFHPVEPGKGDESGELTVDGVRDLSPFKIWFLNREPGKKNITKGAARSLVGEAVAHEIAVLLTKGSEGKVCVEGRPIHAGDIAVLVHTNWEARDMLRVLKDFRVPGVIYSAESIFSSHEAMEIERLLRAVLEPANEAYVKSALTTDFLGLTGDDLAGLAENDKAWDVWVEKFESYRSIFLSQGFIAMARDMLTREGVKQRLRVFPDGERRVTNVLHCIELLHSASIEKKLGTEGLLKWLQEKRRKENAEEADEYQIRLETDEKAVKIITIHKSKGLEYPIVFCPYSWNGGHRSKEVPIIYHDEEKANQPIINIGFPAHEKARQGMELEQLSENIRLLYVTLTRAKYRCYLAWGSINESETSALAYLLHHPPGQQQSVNLAEMKDFMKSLGDEQLVRDIQRLVDTSEGTIELASIPKPSGVAYKPHRQELAMLECRQFAGEIETDWRTTSFTALVSGSEQLADIPDRDKEGAGKDHAVPSKPEKLTGKGDSIFDFPKGARPGTCLHNIFEHIDFSLANPEEARVLVGGKLSDYGFEERWLETVYRTVDNVLHTPVMGEGSPFTLSRLAPRDRLHEVEFYPPLGLISPDRLGRAFRNHPISRVSDGYAGIIEGLGFTPHKGMLRGFIDMIFHFGGRYYLVDWKSNFLGGSIEDYERKKLDGVMEKEFYILQYHIYTVALHQFLGSRLKDYNFDEHFGGALYLFIRGMDPSRGAGYGVFFDRPELRLVNNLSRYFTGSTTQ